MYMSQGFIQWGEGVGASPPKRRGKKEKRRGREKGEGEGVYDFGATIYLQITLRLAEYHRLKSITP